MSNNEEKDKKSPSVTGVEPFEELQKVPLPYSRFLAEEEEPTDPEEDSLYAESSRGRCFVTEGGGVLRLTLSDNGKRRDGWFSILFENSEKTLDAKIYLGFDDFGELEDFFLRCAAACRRASNRNREVPR